MIAGDLFNPNTMAPQEMLEAAIEIEAAMARLASELVARQLLPAERIDGLARLAVSSEGVQVLVGELLRITEPAPESLPFREDFAAWLELAINRSRGLKVLYDRKDGSAGLVANAAPLVDVTAPLVAALVEKLQGMAAAIAVERFLRASIAPEGEG